MSLVSVVYSLRVINILHSLSQWQLLQLREVPWFWLRKSINKILSSSNWLLWIVLKRHCYRFYLKKIFFRFLSVPETDSVATRSWIPLPGRSSLTKCGNQIFLWKSIKRKHKTLITLPFLSIIEPTSNISRS